MWLIRFHAVPKPNSSELQQTGGAYINCWILYAWQDGAEHLAKFEVEKEWLITEIEEITWIEFEDLEETDREFFLQAQTDGGCFVYYHYPLEAKDEDEDFELENSTANNPKLTKTKH